MPVISVVGRINFNRAQTDVLVYAVPKDYLLKGTNNDLIKGKLFANNNTIKEAKINGDNAGQVAGLSTELVNAQYGARVNNSKTFFNILPGRPAPVWSDCSIESSS